MSEELQNVASVIGMCGSAGSYMHQQVSRDYYFCGCSAYTSIGTSAKWVDPAGSHGAVSAANAELPVSALRKLILQAIPNCCHAFVCGFLDECIGCLANRLLFAVFHDDALSVVRFVMPDVYR